MAAKKINPGKRLHAAPTLADVRRFVRAMREIEPPAEARGAVSGMCWVPSGYADEKGYKQFKFRGRAVWSHRFSAEVFGGIDVHDREVNHLCLRRACCNPAHHERLTHGENSADANRRRRREPAPF